MRIAAGVASAAMVVTDVFMYFVYRDWRADLASRIDEPAKRPCG
ncbi:hypothetical protein ACFZBU_47280 [Embleya sp. NPDC008237]